MRHPSVAPAAIAISIVVITMVARPINAQPSIEAIPDTVFFSNQTNDNKLLLVNNGTESLVVDSLHFSLYQPSYWGIFVTSPDTTILYEFQFGELIYGSFIDHTVPPADTLVIDFYGYGSCIICKNNLERPDVRDSLFIHSNVSPTAQMIVPIDFTFWVGVKQDEQRTDVFEAYPNPSNGNLAFRLHSNEYMSNRHIQLYDALGRIVLEQDVSIEPGDSEFSFDVALPNGTYIAAVDLGSKTLTTVIVIVR